MGRRLNSSPSLLRRSIFTFKTTKRLGENLIFSPASC